MRAFIFTLIASFALFAPLAPAQTVTETQWVQYLNKKELLRKINGRWWSNDNREVYPPSRTGVFWELDSDEGVVEFFHHTPADTSRAESLHLFMTIPQVEAIMGKPNRIFRMGTDGGMWMYYGIDGLMVEVRIMDDVLGEAEYEPTKGKSWPVASVAADLGGRSIYKLLAERSTQQLNADRQRSVTDSRPNRAPVRSSRPSASSSSASAQPQPFAPPPEKRIVAREALAAIKIGMPRAEVIAALGEPTSKFGLSTGDSQRETLRYHQPDGSAVDVRLTDGKVTQVP